jgi:hypothetical protein
MRRKLLAVILLMAVAAPALAIWPFTSAKTYPLTVTNGTGSGTFKAGAKVSISANPAPAGMQFSAWLSGGPDAWGTRPSDFANPNAASTTFTMPAAPTTVQATYSGQ